MSESSFWLRERALTRGQWLVVAALVALSIVVFCGYFHIVQSATDGTRFVRKVHFTLSETFVSLDAITGQSAITANARYPLAIKALQREHILESDAMRDARIREEMEAERRKLEAEWLQR